MIFKTFKNLIISITAIITVIGGFLAFTGVARAETNCGNLDATKGCLSVVIRNSSGMLFKNTGFEVYEEGIDKDNQTYFSRKIGAGNTGLRGYDDVIIKFATGETGKKVGVRIYSPTNKSFYFDFLDRDISPATRSNFEARLSSISVSMGDYLGNVLRNRRFNFYKQSTDFDSKVISGQAVVKGFSSGESGAVEMYLPAGSYILEIDSDIPSLKYRKEGIQIYDSQRTSVFYKLSAFGVFVKDSDGFLIPKQKFSLYQQNFKLEKDTEENPDAEVDDLTKQYTILGNRFGTYDTGSAGQKIIYLPPGYYTVSMPLDRGKETFFYNQLIDEGEYHFVDYKKSALSVTVKDYNNQVLTNLKTEVYLQDQDALGKKILGQKILDKNTDASGRALSYLAPDVYAVKIKNPSGGLDYTLWDKEVEKNKTTNISYRLSAIKVVIKDKDGKIWNNKSFYVAEQSRNSVGKLFISKMIKGGLSTGFKGYEYIYLPKGAYALKSGDSEIYDVWIDEMETKEVTWQIDKNKVTLYDLLSHFLSPYSSTTLTETADSAIVKDSDGDGLTDDAEVNIYKTNPNNPDTDGDGYTDKEEIENGISPLIKAAKPKPAPVSSSSFYGQKRLGPTAEQQLARQLKEELRQKVGDGQTLNISAKNWSTFVNAYIYGKYSAQELADTLKQSGIVHPSIPAEIWRKTQEYKKALSRIQIPKVIKQESVKVLDKIKEAGKKVYEELRRK